MRIGIVHGYFLGDSGSGIYVSQLARELTRQGHEVTLVCQEQHPDIYDFIDSAYALDGDGPLLLFQQEKKYAGSCRLVRPALEGELLTYVEGEFAPFKSCTFQDATTAQITRFVDSNVRALTAAFDKWPQDLVQANHVVMQPYEVRKALRGKTPYCVTVHGSALNFSVAEDPRMSPYFVEGLSGARSVVSLSRDMAEQVKSAASKAGLDIEDKVEVIPPGVESGKFAPLVDRDSVLKSVAADMTPDSQEIVLFAGRLIWTKGLQYAVAAMPLVLSERPGVHLFIAGGGPLMGPLKKIVLVLQQGNLRRARQLTEESMQIESLAEYGPVIPAMGREESEAYLAAARDLSHHVRFLGQVPHAEIPPLMGASDLMIAPSVFPEAYGLVMIEALAGGAVPLGTYQSGLMDAADIVALELGDDEVKSLLPGEGLTKGIAGRMLSLLEKYPTRDAAFRERLHDIAIRRFSWSVVAEKYSGLGLPGC
jgi:glycosyltransferase involved in cell wall biosynthesis